MTVFWGLLGVAIFSLTLPATKLTVGWFDPFFVGTGRAVLAGVLALGTLWFSRTPFLPPRQRGAFFVTFLGIGFGFPVFTALALQTSAASHSAVVVGLLPLATAVAGVLLAKEKQTWLFWVSSVVGSAVVTGYALGHHHVSFSWSDFFLLCAVASAAVGYATGGRLARVWGGWNVIQWTLVIGLPLSVIGAVLSFHFLILHAPVSAWTAFFYVAVFSAFLGFFPWYRGLSRGGIGKIGQLQLFQPLMTITVSVVFLGEPFDLGMVVVVAVVAVCVLAGRRPLSMRILGEVK